MFGLTRSSKLAAAFPLLNAYTEGYLVRHLPSQQSSSLSSAASDSGRILVACVFERLPVVMPPPPAWETEYQQWRDNLNNKYMKTLAKDFTDPKRGDQQAEQGPQWQPAPLQTPADISGDKTTLHRRLDQRIFFLVQSKTSPKLSGSKDSGWTFPSTEVQPGESTRQAAERVLCETISMDKIQPYFVGNAPAGHVEGSSNTEKMFFHRCQLIQGTPALAGSGLSSGFVWATKDELGEYIKDEAMLELMKKML